MQMDGLTRWALNNLTNGACGTFTAMCANGVWTAIRLDLKALSLIRLLDRKTPTRSIEVAATSLVPNAARLLAEPATVRDTNQATSGSVWFWGTR